MKKLDSTYREASLLKKALLNEATDEELNVLEQHFSEHPKLKEVYEKLQNSEELKEEFSKYDEYSSEKAYQKFLDKIEQQESTSKKSNVRNLKTWWGAVAAVVILAVGFTFFAIYQYRIPEKMVQPVAQINPGSQRATLKLSDGSAIDVQNKDIDLTIDGIEVKYDKGLLTYRPTVTTQQQNTAHDNYQAPEASNELVTPRGGENTVLLSDGTTIHLNAGSKLTYPVRFTGKQRLVNLDGEGYFEVTKDEEHPFIVQTDFGDVTVRGTIFNINAYSDADTCYTTLVSGKVDFNSTDGTKKVTLLPGEQAISSSEGIKKEPVDVDEFIGWAKGMYVFKDTPLEEIMDAFEKWYNVHIYYEDTSLQSLTYTGMLKRSDTMNTFLDALVKADSIRYIINGQNILIYGN